MDFKRIDNALKVCSNHLDATNPGPEIESYLVGYLLVLACSEFEQRFEALVAKRCARSTDSVLIAFMAQATDKLFRSPRIKEMAGFLERLGAKDVFAQMSWFTVNWNFGRWALASDEGRPVRRVAASCRESFSHGGRSRRKEVRAGA